MLLQHHLPPRSKLNQGEMAQHLQDHTLLDICCPKKIWKKDNHIDIGSAQCWSSMAPAPTCIVICGVSGVKPNPKKSWVLNASVDIATQFLNVQPKIKIVDNRTAIMVLGVPVGGPDGRTALIKECVRNMEVPLPH